LPRLTRSARSRDCQPEWAVVAKRGQYVGEIDSTKANPAVDILDRLAETLGISISELLGQLEKGPVPPKPAAARKKADPKN
jgi:transcriptional regulator with XRE-family HTH domain